ncbi:hypothetical protein KAV46_02875 [Candidatus Bathyarchaeota archaeon]|nr:hypothetical protein [Candidatus Bathyarchaeota archaeon]
MANKGAPVVTPWEVKGEIDYDRLMERFGTEPITPELLERIQRKIKVYAGMSSSLKLLNNVGPQKPGAARNTSMTIKGRLS